MNNYLKMDEKQFKLFQGSFNYLRTLSGVGLYSIQKGFEVHVSCVPRPLSCVHVPAAVRELYRGGSLLSTRYDTIFDFLVMEVNYSF